MRKEPHCDGEHTAAVPRALLSPGHCCPSCGQQSGNSENLLPICLQFSHTDKGSKHLVQICLAVLMKMLLALSLWESWQRLKDPESLWQVSPRVVSSTHRLGALWRSDPRGSRESGGVLSINQNKGYCILQHSSHGSSVVQTLPSCAFQAFISAVSAAENMGGHHRTVQYAGSGGP